MSEPGAPPDPGPGPGPEDEAAELVPLPLHPVRATWVLMAANVALFALETLWGGSTYSPTLYHMGANAGRQGLIDQPWRALSSAFLHIGFVHLLLNMWALAVFGRTLEMLVGAWRLLVLYALSALGGGLASSAFREETLSAGASGAVWGLMLAELVLLLRPQAVFEGISFNVSKGTVLQPLVVNLLWSLQPGIDLLGHLGGGMAGALVVVSGLLRRAPESRAWRWAGAGAALLMAASVGLALARGRPWDLRAPVLEARPLPAVGAVVPVPRGLSVATAADTATFGNLRRDPLQVEARVFALDRPLPRGEQRAALEREAREAAALPVEGGRRERPPAVVDLPHGPAFHDAVVYPNGARVRMWYVLDGARGLRVVVTQRPGAPAAWDALPERIAQGIVFSAGATGPGPSSPARPPAPGPAGPRPGPPATPP